MEQRKCAIVLQDQPLLDRAEQVSLRREARRVLRRISQERGAELRWRARQIARETQSRDGLSLTQQVRRVLEHAAATGVAVACEAIWNDWGRWSAGDFANYDTRASSAMLNYLKAECATVRPERAGSRAEVRVQWEESEAHRRQANGADAQPVSNAVGPDEPAFARRREHALLLSSAIAGCPPVTGRKLARLLKWLNANPDRSAVDAWLAQGWSRASLRQTESRIKRRNVVISPPSVREVAGWRRGHDTRV